MPLKSMVLHLMKSTLTSELINRISNTNRLLIQGGSRGSRAIITTTIAKASNKPLVVIVPTLEDASRWYSVLQCVGWNKILMYPSSESSPYDTTDTSLEIIWGQLQVLSELVGDNINNDTVIIATERSLQPHLPPKEVLKAKCIKVKKRETIDLEQFAITLAKLGYERTSTTDQEGTWSRRGDIVDIFPVNSELPVRLELFGDEIDKLREFDPVSQRSLESLNEVNLTPTSLNPLIAEKLAEDIPDIIDELLDDVSLEQLISGNSVEGIKRLIGLAWESPSSLLDYIPSNSCLVIDEKSQCISHGDQWFQHADQTYQDILHSFSSKDSQKLFSKALHRSSEDNLFLANKFYGFDLTELIEESSNSNTFDLASRSISYIPNQFGKISENIRNYLTDGFSIWIISSQPSRTVALLEEHECITRFVPNSNDIPAIQRIIHDNTPVALKNNSISEIEGIVMPSWKVVLLTDKEIFGQHTLSTTSYIRKRKTSKSIELDPNRMNAGDYVVHRNHGIGKFIKIEKINISGKSRDYLVVQYLDGTLSVAADQLGSLSRFRSSNTSSPKINKLGGQSWISTKEKARKQIKKIAIDLVRLYAERNKAEGFSFPADGPWQSELEDSFPYEPTPDQRKAVDEVKKDMEKSQPMDRLVCGDVGFGKTEVAVRAMFKAITAGKQVVLLAPTTVLAQQHWRTITDRFAPYPIKVSLLNRFRTTTDKKNIIKKLSEGTIDALVGTHQILSKHVEFKNLGLLVIDEEQRFGVNHKEKIKALKKNIDVLTLSATPIPRTLYMSLSGVREMSLITTPPPMRRPIKTHLSSFDDEAIRSAICQELDRGGQIFYVVPRIEGINEVASKLKHMVPKLKLLVAHGQMDEGALESAMVAFNSGESDLMLCTTIIESGLDIPRVNTIIIEDSHKFGLSQLYQLRGRVGRSGVQAHAWMFYPSSSTLTDAARQRLKAIQEFAQLGSGYQLAMRDMEIRGVGNILGVQQSGQMEAIGFDLYMELLQESLTDLQGQSIPSVEECQIDLQVTAFIPGNWIIDNEEKINAYRSATQCESFNELLDIASIWIDRYGSLPEAVESLIEVMKLKILSKKCGISRIKQDKNNILLETPMEEAAFRLLRQGLPDHLHTRFIFKGMTGSLSLITVRGLGILSVEKQMSQLIDWFKLMAKMIPNNEGLNIYEVKEREQIKNDQVITV